MEHNYYNKNNKIKDIKKIYNFYVYFFFFFIYSQVYYKIYEVCFKIRNNLKMQTNIICTKTESNL